MWKLIVVFVVMEIHGHPLNDQLQSVGNNNLPEGANRRRQPFRIALVNGVNCTCNIQSPTPPRRDDYQYTPGIGYHKFHTRALKWNSARKSCEDEGGHLAIINSQAEEQVLLRMYSNAPEITGTEFPGWAYLGIHDLYEEGEWITIHGKSLASTGFNKWVNGEPSSGSRENCGLLYKYGGLNDGDCNTPNAYFCEIPETRCLH